MLSELLGILTFSISSPLIGLRSGEERFGCVNAIPCFADERAVASEAIVRIGSGENFILCCDHSGSRWYCVGGLDLYSWGNGDFMDATSFIFIFIPLISLFPSASILSAAANTGGWFPVIWVGR